MKRLAIGTIKVTLRTIGYGVIGVLAALLVVFVLFLENRSDLKIWHTVDLDEKFTANTPVASFPEYLELENRLFTKLDKLIYSRKKPKDRRLYSYLERRVLEFIGLEEEENVPDD
jgi:hypothetical protein